MATKRKRGSSRIRTIVFGGALVASLGLVLGTSPIFELRSFRVVGNVRLSREEVRVLAGVEGGENVLTLSSKEIRSALLRNPWVSDARVDRSLPSSILVSIVERTAVAHVRDPGGFAIIAPDGIVLRRAERPPSGTVSLGRWPSLLRPADRYGAGRPMLEALGGFPRGLRARVATVRMAHGAVTFDLRNGGVVLYGEPELHAAKSGALGSLLRWAEERGVTPRRIDLRAPHTPALEPAR